MLERNLDFCRVHGINVPEKRKFELTFLYHKRMENFDQEISELKCLFDRLTNVFNEYKEMYNLVSTNASELGQPFMEAPEMPTVDFSQLELAAQKIVYLIGYYTQGQKENAYRCLFQADRVMKEAARRVFIERAVKNLPSDKSVVVVTTDYTPYEYNQKKFWENVDKMSTKNEARGTGIAAISWYEWLAFCPKMQQDIEKIVKSWGGNPKVAKVEYR